MDEKKKSVRKSKYAVIAKITAIAVALVIIAFLAYLFVANYIYGSEALKGFVSEHIVIGTVIMIFINAFQVIVAIVPGELVEIATGYALGGFYGSIVSLVGTVIGSAIAIKLTRKIGEKFASRNFSYKKLESLSFLRNKKIAQNARADRNILCFVLFLIPGTPKDLLTYIIALGDIRISTYLITTSLARYPSILTSTLSGAAFSSNRVYEAIELLIYTAIISLVGVIVYRIISRRVSEQKKKSSEENTKTDGGNLS